ncbi:MAG: sugar phosphate isomerase/epimerase family protein [Pirellulales bacterium]
MKVGIDSYCYHRFLGDVYPEQQPPADSLTMDRVIDRARELGCEGISLESCFFPSFDASYLADVRARLDAYQFDRVYAWGHPDGLEAGRNLLARDDMILHIRHARAIGATVMRVVGSSFSFVHEPHEPQLRIISGWLKEAVRVAASEGVSLAIENHIDYDADEILRLVEEVDSPFFGVTLDTANFLRVLDDPVAATEKLAPYVLATHIKDIEPVKGRSVRAWNYFACVAAGEGLVEIDAIIAILARAGYRGLLAFETDMPAARWLGREDEMVERSVAYLKRLTVAERTHA